MEGWLVLAIYCELFGLATTLFMLATAFGWGRVVASYLGRILHGWVLWWATTGITTTRIRSLKLFSCPRVGSFSDMFNSSSCSGAVSQFCSVE